MIYPWCLISRYYSLDYSMMMRAAPTTILYGGCTPFIPTRKWCPLLCIARGEMRFDVANFSSPNPRENHNCKLRWMHYLSLSRASFVYGWNIGVLHRPYEHQVHNLCEHYFYWPFASFPLSLSPPRYIIFNHGSWKAHPNRLPRPPSWSFVFRCSQGTPRRTEDHPRSLRRNDHLWFTCS